MLGSRLSHVHLHVGDAVQAAYYYGRAFGFDVVAQTPPHPGGRPAPRHSMLLAQGRIRLLLTSAAQPHDPVARYVAAHGDGIADIAIAVPDVARAFEAAVAGGAQPVAAPTPQAGPGGSMTRAVLGGFGDVVHTLIPLDVALPDPGLAEVPEPERAPLEPSHPLKNVDRLEDVDHVAVCLPAGELDKTAQLYRTAFGFDEIFEEFIEVGGQAIMTRIVRDPSSGITLTLIEADQQREPGQIDTFLTSHGGAGVQHLAFATGDIKGAVATLSGQGVEFLPVPGAYYDRVEERVGPLGRELPALRAAGILADRDPWGLLLQIFTRSPYARRTLFLELIERRGGQTFGGGNIKSLYEAVRRDHDGR